MTPVAGAQVLLADQKIASTDIAGYFSISTEVLASRGVLDGGAVSVTVHSSNHGTWTIESARYRSGDTLRLYPRLAAGSPILVHGPALGVERPRAYSAALLPGFETEYTVNSAALSGTLAPPATIRIYRTQTGVVEVVPFKQYVKHVLPHEWISSWSPEALKAGAMAVKTYAWYWVQRGGKQVALGADLKDNTEDQVYDPSLSYASTDAAVEATFNYAMTRNGSLFQAQYCAGNYKADPAGDCPWAGPYMTQWGSAFHADQGRGWGWILGYYYGATVTPRPPGQSYDGRPPSYATAVPPREQPTPAPAYYAVGQGSDRPEVFQEAYTRNGGEAILGKPVGPVRWWMQYLSEVNVLSQRLSGPRGLNDVWIVYNVLRSNSHAKEQAYVLTGEIGTAYAAHQPPGPEWAGAPTSDPFISLDGRHSQGFVNGLLQHDGQEVLLVPWPAEFAGWKAEYFAGYARPETPSRDVAARSSFVMNVETPNFTWQAADGTSQRLGAGKGVWTLQLTRQITIDNSAQEFTLNANAPVVLWVDDRLVVNGLDGPGTTGVWGGQIAPGRHEVRVQYFATGGDAQLGLSIGTSPPPLPESNPLPGIIPPDSAATLKVTVRWLGGKAAPDSSWARPIALHLSNVETSERLLTVEGKTNEDGVALFEVLPPGRYNVHVKGPHSLQSAVGNIELVGGTVISLDMKAQIEGDVDGDNCVTVDDFARVQAMLGAHIGIEGFDAAADLDGDGIVTMQDISLLRSGFDMCGDVPVGGGVQAMSEPGSRSLGDYLAPWTNPDALRRNLQMRLVATTRSVRVGETLDVRVTALTGNQPVDGASFVLRYDPRLLRPVDLAGNDALGAEPGLALPAVMGNWIDAEGGAIGYSAGILQGTPPQGEITIATLRFRVLGGSGAQAHLALDSAPSGLTQITNGGINLLADVRGLATDLVP
jgi:hypothetical protein